MKTKTSVIIPAAGNGKRMGSSIRKQYILLNKKPILWYTLSVFQNHKEIDQIIVVCPKVDLEQTKQITSEFSKVTRIVEGGKERQDSVYNGFKAVDKDSDFVLVHDGVRPFLTKEMVTRVIEKLHEHDCVITGIEISSTLKSVDKKKCVTNTLNRDNIREIQTPQGMVYNIFKKCYAKAFEDNFYGTDESMIAEYNSVNVFVVDGERLNIKITQPEDIDLGHFLLSKFETNK